MGSLWGDHVARFTRCDILSSMPRPRIPARLIPPRSVQEIPSQVITQMITLATSGFGLVAALAWNEFIKTFIDSYIRPYFGKESGLISQFIYALIVTLIAVLVTLQLSSIKKKMERVEQIEKIQ